MDLGALESRLENWARAQWSSGYAPGRCASAEGGWRGGGWRELRPAPSPIDTADAEIVNEAWKRLMQLDKDVLRMHYVWRAHSDFICRRLKLVKPFPVIADAHVRVWMARKGLRLPRSTPNRDVVWNMALAHAQRAIYEKLAERKEMKIAYARKAERIAVL
jgi:hypothetical protein